MLCFEVQINDRPPVTAGAEEISVLVAALTYVSEHDDLGLRVGGMISYSKTNNEHLDWLNASLQVGDSISIRVVDSTEPTEPTSRKRDDPELAERARRKYFEQLKKEYGE